MAASDRSESRITVVVVTWNGAHLLGACLDSLRAQTEPHQVLVVDNASTDSTARVLADDHSEASVLRLDSNVGFAGGAQAGLDAVATTYAAFLNNDAVAEPGWLAALVAELDASPSVVGVTSRMLLMADGRVNNAGGALTRSGVGYDRGYGQLDGPPYDKPADVAAFCGGACAMRSDDARRVGGFPTLFFLYYEDTDLSWRLRRAGMRIRYVPDAVVHHEHSATSDQSSPKFAFYNQRNQLLMLVRNAPWSLAIRSFARLVVVTVVCALRRRRDEHTARPMQRVRVVTAFLRALPRAVGDRRHLNSTATMSRRSFCRQWLGTEAR